MSLAEYIATYKPPLTEKLQQFFSEKRGVFATDLQAVDLFHRLEKFSTRGKMLRGILVILGYEVAGGKTPKDVLDLAVAIELSQSGLLIHDDIMDNDQLRRGEKTIFAQYEEIAKEEGSQNALFFGQGMGLCAGDISFFLALEALAKGVGDTKPYNSESFTWYTYILQKCVLAQMLDFRAGQTAEELTVDQIISLGLNKTGYYSIVLPLLLGAHKAEANKTLVKSLEEIGKSIGIIFQVKDDELGILGKTEDIGKPEGSDIRENKKTLIRHFLFESATEVEKKELETIFGNKLLTASQHQKVKDLYHKYTINKQIDAILTPFVTLATQSLKSLPTGEYTNILNEFLVYNLKRKI